MPSAQVYMQDQQKMMQKYHGQGQSQQQQHQQHQQQQQQLPREEQMMLGPALNMNLGVQPTVDMHGNVTLTGLALGPGPVQNMMSYPALSSNNFSSGSMNLGGGDWTRYRDILRQDSFRGNQVDDIIFEEDLRAKSSEMLDNEDMHMQIQQLLRMFNGGQMDQLPMNYAPLQGEEPYPYSSYPPNTPDSLSVERTRPNGKAYVGWLKLKAALRWGIFIRKMAATRRAQLEEIEDDSEM